MMDIKYNGNKYVRNNFIDELKKISPVIIPDIKYKHIYHYQKNDIYKQKKDYYPIKNLTLDDLCIEKTIQELNIDKRKKYIVMGYSDGIYFAMEFALQYPKLVKEMISLDGSWITIKLCKQRLLNWKNNGTNKTYINSQKKLDLIMNDVIVNKNTESLNKIMNHKRYEHTKKCINKKYQNIIISKCKIYNI